MVLPTDAYLAIEEISDDNTQSALTFQHLPSEIGAIEAEEVGVEHLLRDITDATSSDLSSKVTDKLSALNGLMTRLKTIEEYLQEVLANELPVNHQIIYQLQDIFNLLPNLNMEHMAKAFAVKTNDQLLVIYLSSIIRSVIALHDLINNKIELKEEEQKMDLETKKAQEEKTKKEEEEQKETEQGESSQTAEDKKEEQDK
eukprot:TRINITY_DN873_c0_g1_i2.p1 TRINITY_DN873_c0_g1~~TRINITY_DN873_c0_g1_i2.p1  ORF type:complete len:200 (-),score=103.73 TRINITY_DN873_c0_g1_i2:253-852(-)